MDEQASYLLCNDMERLEQIILSYKQSVPFDDLKK